MMADQTFMEATSTPGASRMPSPASIIFPGIFDGPRSDDSSSNVVVVDTDYNPRLPNGIVVAVLMMAGFVGNALVLYIYHFKMNKTVFTTFVTVLALLDMATVLVGMPIDVSIKTVLFGNTDALDGICKVAHFEVYTTSLASGSVLLLITVTRYKKICTPLEPGLTQRRAKMLCAFIFVCAAAFCSVTFVVNGNEKIWIAVGKRSIDGKGANETLNTDMLTTSTPNYSQATYAAERGNSFPLQQTNPPGPQTPGPGSNAAPQPNVASLNSGLEPSIASETVQSGNNESVGGNETQSHIPLTVTEVVEVIICRTSESQKGTALYYIVQAMLMSAFIVIFISLIVLHYKISNSVAEFERRRSSMRRASVSSDPESHLTHITATMYRIFATITIIFLVSYLPHLICLGLEKGLYKPGEAIPKVVRMVLDLAYNFPYINVVANPLIYGYKSAKFRRYCKRYLRKICCCCLRCFCKERY